MALTTAGATLIAQMVRGASTTDFNAANAYIGVGDSSTAFAIGQTDLQAATNKARIAMDSGYPSGASNVLTYQATASTSVANFEWVEIGLFNASSGGTMLGRKVESPSLGTKTNTQSWTIQLTATFTAA